MASNGSIEGRIGFLHGVASFDPLPDAVLIWTRFTPASPAEAVAVGWQVSDRSDFGSIVAGGSATTDAARDFTVTVDAADLRPGTRYWYRFSSGKLHSEVGATKTAAAGPLEALTYAAVSCSNWAYGFFHPYHVLSKVDDLDFVVHCGDYIYEYGKGVYPSRHFMARHGLRPKHRCTTLDDYRQRYACYRTDPALRELHRRVPMVAVWDDHEIMDDAHEQGAGGFDGGKSEWKQRSLAAVQAFVEWVPVRGMSHERLDLAGCHRTLHFGDLMTLMLVENRLSHRMPPIEVEKTDFYKLAAQTKTKDWDEEKIRDAAEELKRQLADPSREMIGRRQVEDVGRAVQESVAAGRPWQVLVSQTVLSPIKAPKLQATVRLQPPPLAWICRKALKTATSNRRAGKEGAEMARMYLAMGKFGVPMNPRAYDGYAGERAKLLQALSVEGSNPVVMAGDSHNAWAHDIVDSSGRRLGVEFDAPAVTAVGAFEDIHQRFEEKVGAVARKLFPLYLFTPWVEDALLAANSDTLKFCNLDRRGFVLYHVTRGKFHAEFHSVSSVRKKSYEHYCSAAFDVEAGIRGRLRPGVRYLTIDGQLPQREQPKRSAILRSTRGVRRNTW